MKNFLIGLLVLGSFSAFASSEKQPSEIILGTSGMVLTRSQQNIAYSSDANGVCKYFGYSKALKNSKEKSTFTYFDDFIGYDHEGTYREYGVVIKKNGEQKRMKYGAILAGITCIRP